MRLAALPLVLATSLAYADGPDLDLSLEAGSELDTNPHRETAEPGSDMDPEPALVGRLGARGALVWRPREGHALRAGAIAAAKKFVGGDQAEDEDVAVLAGDLRYELRVPERPASIGARLAYYDALERAGVADHDFRTGDGTLSLTLFGENDHRAVLGVGYRVFRYKPDARYDFAGEHVQLSWRKRWESEADEIAAATFDLGVEYGLERRVFNDRARINQCPPGSELEPGCIGSVEPARIDVVHRGAAELTYTGERLYAARYELRADLSSSFGQSLLRHRLELSATTELPAEILVTLRAVVQYNQFLDPLLLSRDVGVLTIEDENRNALTVHAVRDFGTRFSGEARVTIYSNEFATQTLEFARQTAYVGVLVRL